jgi:hypothetical protein
MCVLRIAISNASVSSASTYSRPSHFILPKAPGVNKLIQISAVSRVLDFRAWYALYSALL